jgi:hypothetical protein
MKQSIKKLSIGLALIMGLLVFNTSFVALADNASSVCNGVEIAGGGSCGASGDKAASKSISDLLANVVDILSWIVGVVAVIMVILGGLNFVTSGGDSTKAAKARSTILYALVGMVVVAAAQVLVHFVIEKV